MQSIKNPRPNLSWQALCLPSIPKKGCFHQLWACIGPCSMESAASTSTLCLLHWILCEYVSLAMSFAPNYTASPFLKCRRQIQCSLLFSDVVIMIPMSVTLWLLEKQQQTNSSSASFTEQSFETDISTNNN